MYRSCSSHALVWSSAAGFPSFSRMYKEGGRAGRSRSAMIGAGQVNRMSCICRVRSSAHKIRLMVNTSLKSRRRGAASVSRLTCAQQPAVSTYKYSSTHGTDWQYIMELLFFQDIDFSRISKLICMQGNKGNLLFDNHVSNNTKAAHMFSLYHYTSRSNI